MFVQSQNKLRNTLYVVYFGKKNFFASESVGEFGDEIRILNVHRTSSFLDQNFDNESTKVRVFKTNDSRDIQIRRD